MGEAPALRIGELYRDARRAATWGLVVSLSLGAVKLLGGLLGGSVALASDAVHSLVDALISAALLAALALAEKPADREHPYGHARVEALAGQGVALLLLGLAVGIAWVALSGLGRSRQTASPEGFTLAIAAAGAMVQEGLYRYTTRVARRTGSSALMATAWDYRLDVLGSLVVLSGVALARLGGPRWQWADHAAGAGVAATIFWVGLSLLWTNAQGLMDRQADEDLLASIRREAAAVDGVRGVETLRVRKAGLERLVDIHIEVDPNLTVRQGHSIAHRVKDRLIGGVAGVRDVLVHVEPAADSP